MLYQTQCAFFDFCMGNCHRIVAGVQVKAVKVTPKLLVLWVEVAKEVQLVGLSCKCGTNYTLCCGLARVRVESDKIVLKIKLSPKFGTCVGGNSENGMGNIFPMHYKECSLVSDQVLYCNLGAWIPFLMLFRQTREHFLDMSNFPLKWAQFLSC